MISKTQEPFYTDAGAAILAGGQSLRMGQDKGLLDIHGRTMIAVIAEQLKGLFGEIVIGADDVGKYAFLGMPVFADESSGKGPMMGILSCLCQSRSEQLFLVGCDIPLLSVDLIHQLMDADPTADVVVPRYFDGRVEPLFAVYRKSAIEHIRFYLGKGRRSVHGFFDFTDVCYVPIREKDHLDNLNTYEEYVEFCEKHHDIMP